MSARSDLMPSSASVQVSSLSNIPGLPCADAQSKQQGALALAADFAGAASPGEGCTHFIPAKELPPATLACLEVLNQLLVDIPLATAAAADAAARCDDVEPDLMHEEVANGSWYQEGETGRDVVTTTQVVDHTCRNRPTRSSDLNFPYVERTNVTEHGNTKPTERKTEEDTREESNGDDGLLRFNTARSFSSIFKLLKTAGVLDTLPKCLHMLHAICILADERQRVWTSAAAASGITSMTVAFSPGVRKRKLVERCLSEKALGNVAQASACVLGSCNDDATREGCEFEERREPSSTSIAAPADSTHDTQANADQDICCKRHALSSSAGESESEFYASDCEPPIAAPYSSRAPTQRSKGHRWHAEHSTLQLQTASAQIAGVLLGCIEALEAPPPLSDPAFLKKILHVLSHLFYTIHPLETETSTVCGSSTTALVTPEPDSSNAAGDNSGFRSKNNGDAASKAVDQVVRPSDVRKCAGKTTVNGRPVLTLSQWRRHIITRFDTVERLLLRSVAALFVKTAASAKQTEGTVAAEAAPATVEDSAAAGKDLHFKPGDADMYADGSAAVEDIAVHVAERGKTVRSQSERHAMPVSKSGASAVLLQGRERCRRALRMVRRWVAFLLELEQERRTLVERVLQASEEVQGLPHMLLRERQKSEQHVFQIDVTSGEKSCSLRSVKKTKSLLSLRSSVKEGTSQEQQKCGPVKKSVGDREGAGEKLEELETRIQATEQLLLLPSIPPFDREDFEAVCIARARFARCLLRWREAQDRRRHAEEEARRKAAAAATAVAYVTERMVEQQQAQAAVDAASPGTASAVAALVRLRSISHAFYLLGLNPQTATFQMVEQVRKRWRVLLHPDKFVSTHSHLLQQATEAFKALKEEGWLKSSSRKLTALATAASCAPHAANEEGPTRNEHICLRESCCDRFHVAVTEANRVLSQRRVEPNWSPPPPPPDFTSGADLATAATAQNPPTTSLQQQGGVQKESTSAGRAPDATAATTSWWKNPPSETQKSCCPPPTHHFLPDFTVQVSHSKRKARTGGLVLHVKAAPVREADWPFAVIKEIRAFVLRQGSVEAPRWKLVPSQADVCVLIKKSVELKCGSLETNGESGTLDKRSVSSTECTIDIDALQPIELGVEKVYWVGVQVEGLRSSQSLTTWKPITVCLALPEEAEDGAAACRPGNGSPRAPVGDATVNLATRAGSTACAPAIRALLAFLQTFVAAPFVREDCAFNARLQRAIASLRRVRRQRKRTKRIDEAQQSREDTEERKWVKSEATEVLRECMERARTWNFEAAEKATSTAPL